MPETRPVYISRIRLFIVLVGVVAFAACSRERVNGSPHPPASFGKVERNWLGCADLSGLYAWPPVQGEMRSVSLAGEKFRTGSSLEPIKAPMLSGEAQIWVSGATGGRSLVVQSRRASADLIARGELPTQWNRDEIARVSLSCSGAWIALDGATIVDKPDSRNHRETSSEGLRMARLKDGSLAVGQWVRYSGRRDSINIFGAELAEFAVGDVVSWSWARLARVSDSGKVETTAVKPAPPK